MGMNPRSSTAGLQAQIAKGWRPNNYLTNMSMAYFANPGDFVAPSIFPICPVSQSTCTHHGGTQVGTTGESTSAAPDPPIPSQRTAGGDSSDGMHQHHALIPEKMRKLKPGDRVLVAWVQNDAVVVDLVLPATVL